MRRWGLLKNPSITVAATTTSPGNSLCTADKRCCINGRAKRGHQNAALSAGGGVFLQRMIFGGAAAWFPPLYLVLSNLRHPDRAGFDWLVWDLKPSFPTHLKSPGASDYCH